MTMTTKEKRPDNLQAERGEVKTKPSSSQQDFTLANDNRQGEEVFDPSDIAPKFEIYEHGKKPIPPKANAFVDGFLYPGQFSLMYGPSGIGKSAIAMDMLVSASLGLTWARRQTKPLDVLWIPTENPQEFQRRLDAALNIHSSLNKGEQKHWFSESQFHLANETTRSNLETMALHLLENWRDRQQVVVFDTLSQALPGQDENASAVMTQLIYNLRYLLSIMPDLHVMAVHHSGKHKERGARGHSSLTAAADTEIAVFGTVIHVVNQRSGESGARVKFKLREIEYSDQFGEIHSSVGVDYP